MEQQEQEQEGMPIHQDVLDAIELNHQSSSRSHNHQSDNESSNRNNSTDDEEEDLEERSEGSYRAHELVLGSIAGRWGRVTPTPVDRHSMEYLLDYVRRTPEVTSLKCTWLSLSSDATAALRDFLASEDDRHHLTKLEVAQSIFGTAQDSVQFLGAFETNRSITDLTIRRLYSAEEVEEAIPELVACISRVLQNNTTLTRLSLCQNLYSESIRAMQPGLRENRHLKELRLWMSPIRRDVGVTLIVDALVGNTILEELDIGNNFASSQSVIADITRLVESTKLHKIHFGGFVFDTVTSPSILQGLVRAVSKNTVLTYLGRYETLSSCLTDLAATQIYIYLARNLGLTRAASLLALQPRTANQGRRPIRSKSGIWCKAFWGLAAANTSNERPGNNDIPTHVGASAIFKILQARPAILEPQLKRPPAAAAAAAATSHPHTQQESRQLDEPQDPPNKRNKSGGDGSMVASNGEDTTGGQKRRRL